MSVVNLNKAMYLLIHYLRVNHTHCKKIHLLMMQVIPVYLIRTVLRRTWESTVDPIPIRRLNNATANTLAEEAVWRSEFKLQFAVSEALIRTN